MPEFFTNLLTITIGVFIALIFYDMVMGKITAFSIDRAHKRHVQELRQASLLDPPADYPQRPRVFGHPPAAPVDESEDDDPSTETPEEAKERKQREDKERGFFA